MLSQLISFEFSYQRKQYFFFLGAFIFLLFGLLLVKQTYDINYNSSYKISNQTALVSLGSVFMIMFFVISGVLRERNYETESLIFTTKLSKTHFFVSRFLGVFVFSLLAFSFLFLGLILGLFIHDLDATRIADFNILMYLWSWFIFALPNVFICSSIIFSVALLSKNSLAVYSSAVLIYAFYFLCSMFFESPLMASSASTSAENLQLAAILDPFGISAFFEQTTYWTNQEKNTLWISFTDNLLINRILWIATGIFILSFAYKVFSFRSSNTSIKKQKNSTEKEIPHFISVSTFGAIEPNYKTFKTHWNSYLIQTKINLQLIFKSLPFVAVLLVFMIIVLIESYTRTTNGGSYNESLFPVTFILIDLFKDVLKSLMLFLIVFYSGEIVWKERELKFNGILEALPVKNTTLFFSKLTVLIALPFILIFVGILLSIGLQISKSYFNFEFDLYASVFYYQGVSMIFYSVLALFIQSIIKNKYLGMLLLGCFILLFGTSLSLGIGVEHPLLRFGNLPNISYSDMNGYNVGGFHYLALHWTLIGLFLAILTFKIWKRGEKTISISELLTVKKSNLFLGITFILPLFSALFIVYQTNFEIEYLTQNKQLDRQESYERKYKSYENIEKLVPVSIAVEMDIFPNQQKYQAVGKYILRNKSNEKIYKLFITEKEKLSNIVLQDAKLIEQDSSLGILIFEFENPILPNQEITFSYQITKEVKEFETSKSILKNGSYIGLRDFSPILSYAKSWEIKDSYEREKRNLPKRIEEKVNEDDLNNDDENGIGKINFEAILSTSSDQIAITSGNLIKKWTKNQRNYYHYKTPILISPAVSFFSANYAVQKETYKGISIEHYYHPSHNFNNQKITESIKTTLDYCTKNYGKYPFKELRILEIPAYWSFGGFAHAGTISMVEDRLYLTDTRNVNDFDLVTKRTIHEVAHQWWGHTLSPKNVEGASLIVEGFTKYNEAMIMEIIIGKKALFQLGKTANKQYFKGKTYTNETEPALYLARGESYLSYGKSYAVMLALKELIGEEKVNQVLKNLVEKHQNKSEFSGTSLDFLEEVYKFTPQKHHSLINDWFKKRIIYDLKIENVSSKKLANDSRGNYEITLQVKAKRFETLENKDDTNEKIVSIPIDEPITIGLFSVLPSQIDNEKESEQIIYLDSKTINQELNTFTFYVNELPIYASIDPFFTRLDKNLEDNIMEIGE